MRLIVIFLSAYLILSTQSVLTQSSNYSGFDSDKMIQDELMQNQKDEKSLSQTKSLYGDIIIPEFYYVGPGDILAIQNLTANVMEQYVTVTPENSVLIPRIGEIIVKGMTLKETKTAIIQAIKARNENALISISLKQPRVVVVTIIGNVQNPGTYTLPSSLRVSTVLKLLYQISKTGQSIQETENNSSNQQNIKNRKLLFSESGLPENIDYHSRNISVIHKNSTSQQIDIEEAAITDNIHLDPYIIEGDEIIVPGNPKGYSEISVSGEVIRPCKLPYKKTDNIEKLLKFSRGFKENADLTNVYLISEDGSKLKINIKSDNTITEGKQPVKPGDMLIVGAYKQEVSEPATISIQGCVNLPGNFPIINNKTRLKDAIELAGGFTEKAYLPLAYILRNNREFYNDRSSRWNYMSNFQYSDLTMEDTTRFIMNLELRKPVVSCDFVKLFEEKAENYNIILQDGDMIVVPENPGSVYVFGQVTNPGYVSFTKNKKPDWYIEKAGGYAVKAEKSRMRVIDGRTKVWKKDDDNLIVNAGDEVYVPKPPDMPPGIELQTYAVLASTITAAIVLINLIVGLVKKP